MLKTHRESYLNAHEIKISETNFTLRHILKFFSPPWHAKRFSDDRTHSLSFLRPHYCSPPLRIFSTFSPLRSQFKCQLQGNYHSVWNSLLISTTLYMLPCLFLSKYLLHSKKIFSLSLCRFVITQTPKYKLSKCRGLIMLIPIASVSPLSGTAPCT